MSKYVINQDHDACYRLRSPLYTLPAMHDGKLMGINLYNGNRRLLGTFDAVGEAIAEIRRILSSPRRVVVVSGYCNYDGTNDYIKLAEEVQIDEMAD